MLIKKTVSIIGFVLLSFCFGLGIAGFVSSNANAGEGPPLPACEWGSCLDFNPSNCPPGYYKVTQYPKRQGSECCGTGTLLSPHCIIF